MDADTPRATYELQSLFNGSFCVAVTDATGRRYTSPELWTREAALQWIERDKARSVSIQQR